MTRQPVTHENSTRWLLLDGGVVLTGQQALVIEGADLPLQGTDAPVLRGGLAHIPLAGTVAIHPELGAVMGSTQFAMHCVANWKSQKEAAHMVQVGGIKSPA